MTNETTEPKATAAVGGSLLEAVVSCRKCGDVLRGHDDDGVDICRWCDAGWISDDGNHDAADAVGS